MCRKDALPLTPEVFLESRSRDPVASQTVLSRIEIIKMRSKMLLALFLIALFVCARSVKLKGDSSPKKSRASSGGGMSTLASEAKIIQDGL